MCLQDVYTLVAAKVLDKMRQDVQEAEEGIASRAELARRTFGKHSSTLAALEAAERQVKEDTLARATIARAQMLLPQVDRKLVKQTVSSGPPSALLVTGPWSVGLTARRGRSWSTAACCCRTSTAC